VLVRAMVLPTYWLAYMYQWQSWRFGPLIGPDVSPFVGYIAVPFLTAIQWIITSTIIGGGLGAALIAVLRRSARAAKPVHL
jgi:hypothetical protein